MEANTRGMPVDNPDKAPDDDMWADSRPETEEEIAERERAQRLDSFGLSLAKTRSKAIGYRQQSGIEEIWREDQDFFEGVDELNRGDERLIRHQKPPAAGSGALRSGLNRNRSRVFPNITAPFVESAAAHISDLLIPTEDAPWTLEPTPIPELFEKAEQFASENPELAKVEAKKGFLAKANDTTDTTQPQLAESEQRSDAMVDQNPNTDNQQAFKQVELAKAIAEAAKTRIWDWQVESQFNAQLRQAIEDASRLGTGIIKGPIPSHKKNIGWQPKTVKGKDELGEDIVEEGRIKLGQDIKPESKRVDCWNLFPAAGCGDNIQNGDYIWERDFITIRQLLALKSDDTYLSSQIDMCLQEGPRRAIAEIPETNSLSVAEEQRDKYEIWYGHCMANREDLNAAGCDCEGLENEYIDTMVVMVNERVIKASLPTTDYGGYPYDVYCWRRRKGFWAGIGVARQVRTAQKIVTGGTRAMMDNAGLAGGPMIVMKQGVVRPADGVAGIAPRKIYYIAKDDQTIADATKAIGSIKVDIYVNEMMAIINYGLQQAENNSGFPLLMQGQQGSAPDKVGVVNVLDKNTNAVKRRIARNFSDDMICPHIRRYYIYHLMYGPDAEKGDLQVNVKGYAALVERDIQNQELGAMFNMVLDPRFGLDPKKWVTEWLKARHLNYEDMKVTDEEWQQTLDQWQQILEAQKQGGDPRVQVAQINAESRLQAEQLRSNTVGSVKMADLQFKEIQADMDRKTNMILKAADQELEQLRLQGVSADVVKKLKTDLAREVMKINATFDLVDREARADRLPEPPTEPAGRADTGESYTQ